MRPALILAQVLSAISVCWAQSPKPQARLEAEYYVAAYAQHYRVPVSLVRAIVERESHWQACAVSPKGAAGLMQLMPLTAQRLGVRDRCNIEQSVSGGVRYLADLVDRAPPAANAPAKSALYRNARPRCSASLLT